MNDGQVFDVQSKTSDYLSFEQTARKHKWGGIAESPARWEAYIGWSSLRRLKLIESTWEEFIDDVDLVEGKADDVDPTPVGTGTDS